MKKILILLCIACMAIPASAQITLEKNLTFTGGGNTYTVLFSTYGSKLMIQDLKGFKIRLYDHSSNLWKTINVINKPNYGITWLGHITDKLFNSDTLIEYVVRYQSMIPLAQVPVILEIQNENGQVIKTFPGTPFSSQLLDYNNGMYKLSVYYLDSNNYNIYSLPGTLPCDSCSVGNSSPKPGKPSTNNTLISSPVPNPTTNEVSISYTLPVDVQTGELLFTNNEGRVIKRQRVSDQQSQITVNMAGVPNGIYYYYINAGSSRSDTKKLVLVH